MLLLREKHQLNISFRWNINKLIFKVADLKNLFELVNSFLDNHFVRISQKRRKQRQKETMLEYE